MKNKTFRRKFQNYFSFGVGSQIGFGIIYRLLDNFFKVLKNTERNTDLEIWLGMSLRE